MTTHSEPIVIIGSGLAGYTVARELRKLDTSIPIVLVTKEQGDFYSKPALSTALAQKKTAAQLVTATGEQMQAQIDLKLLAGTDVLSIDINTRQLQTSLGVFSFGKLVLAVGAAPIVLPIDGDGASDVLSVNELADYATFQVKLKSSRRVVIIGAGLIGCEFANDLLSAGITPVVVDPNALPLASLLPPAAGAQLRDSLAAAGVDWRLGTTVTAVHRTPTGYSVILGNGESLEAEVVLSAVGLRPRIALAKAAGIHVNRGIVVDALGRTSAADVYALGDCAEHPCGVLPFVQPIMIAARHLALTLTGSPTAIHFPHMPVTVKTPTHPVVVHKPAASIQGTWHAEDNQNGQDGMTLWFKDNLGEVHGFVLTGAETKKRLAATKLLAA
jgi:rubredoxin---NAD+ reductase